MNDSTRPNSRLADTTALLRQFRVVLSDEPWLPLVLVLFWFTLPWWMYSLETHSGFPVLAGLLLAASIIVAKPVWGTWLTAFFVSFDLPVFGANWALGNFEISSRDFFMVNPYQISALLTAAIVMVGILGGGRRWVTTPCGPPFLVLASLWAFSLVISEYPLETLRQLIKLLFGLWPIAWIAIQTLDTRRKIQITMFLFLLGTALNAATGLIQVFLAGAFDYRLFPDQAALPNGLVGESVIYGIVMSLSLAIALPALWSADGGGALRMASGLFLPLFIGGLMLSGSRSAFFASATVLAVTVLANFAVPWRRSLVLIALCLALVASGVSVMKSLLPEQYDLIATKLARDPARDPRAMAIQAAFETWRNPLWGNGPGTFFPVMSRRYPELVHYISQARGGTIFNLFIGVLYDTGILGLLVILWLLGSYLHTWWRARTGPADPAGYARWVMSLCLFICLLINAQFHPSWQHGMSYLLFALGLVLLREDPDRPQGERPADQVA